MSLPTRLLPRLLGSLWLFPALLCAQTAVAPSGSGTEADPYRIATLENLHWLSGTPAAWARTFEQTADIDASETIGWDSDSGFLPIGTFAVPFQGSYHGRGHTITGLTIHRPGRANVGLFGYLRGAEIESLALVGDSIVGKAWCGGLAGVARDSRISFSSAGGSVRGDYMVGGLVGSLDNAWVDFCRTGGSVSARGDSLEGGAAGGLAAYAYSSHIFNSFASATTEGVSDVGGLVGALEAGEVQDCYATGLLGVSRYGNTGALIGSVVNAWISRTYASVAPLGSRNVYAFIGSRSEGGRGDSSYWDIEAARTTSPWMPTSDSAYRVVALSRAQMMAQASYAGWDFVGTWAIEEGRGLPHLRMLDARPAGTAIHPRRSSAGLAAGIYPLSIHDLHGARVWSGQVPWNGARWDLPRIGAGAWVLRVRTPHGIMSQRVIDPR